MMSVASRSVLMKSLASVIELAPQDPRVRAMATFANDQDWQFPSLDVTLMREVIL